MLGFLYIASTAVSSANVAIETFVSTDKSAVQQIQKWLEKDIFPEGNIDMDIQFLYQEDLYI
jgi:hypothetical protein